MQLSADRQAALAEAQAAAAPSSNLAQAARRFTEPFPAIRRQLWIRMMTALMVVCMSDYLVWMFAHLNMLRWWLALPFAFASLLAASCLLVSAINCWASRISPARPFLGNDPPLVAVLIPTYGEPVPMVMRTVLSVLEQDYPTDRLVVVVSDDGHNPALQAAVEPLGVQYYQPPDRFAPGRDGAAKSGNLNAAWAFVSECYPEVNYIETRDADDELGTPDFLRQVIGQLLADPGLAYVQTVKETQVSAGDMFYNLDPQFYRGQMINRNAANAVFPCGSGLLWRRQALDNIGGFPTWNLVEDLQSGFEALRRGWRSCYLTIVGAVGQHSPEDVPNVYKQRGTWAIDTVRLLVWQRWRGLNVRQRLQFAELLMFYLQAITVPIWIATGALACFGWLPLRAAPAAFCFHLLPYALITEARLLLLNHPFADRRQRQRYPFRALWRLKVMWIGLAPVYIVACAKAIVGGPDRKPVYKVTRKIHQPRWYWRETLPQLVMALVLPICLIIGWWCHTLPSGLILLSAGYWSLMSGAALASFVSRGWYGVSLSFPTLDRRRQQLVQTTRLAELLIRLRVIGLLRPVAAGDPVSTGTEALAGADASAPGA
jgi:cellulose synthase (UDP-forming)